MDSLLATISFGRIQDLQCLSELRKVEADVSRYSDQNGSFGCGRFLKHLLSLPSMAAKKRYHYTTSSSETLRLLRDAVIHDLLRQYRKVIVYLADSLWWKAFGRNIATCQASTPRILRTIDSLPPPAGIRLRIHWYPGQWAPALMA